MKVYVYSKSWSFLYPDDMSFYTNLKLNCQKALGICDSFSFQGQAHSMTNKCAKVRYQVSALRTIGVIQATTAYSLVRGGTDQIETREKSLPVRTKRNTSIQVYRRSAGFELM